MAEDTKVTEAEDTAKEDVIRLHDLRPAPGSNKRRKRVGRGEGSQG